MYQLRLFGFGAARTLPGESDFYSEAPFVLMAQDRSDLIRWIERQAPILFAPGTAIPFEIWKCVGAVPVKNIESGVIYGNA